MYIYMYYFSDHELIVLHQYHVNIDDKVRPDLMVPIFDYLK